MDVDKSIHWLFFGKGSWFSVQLNNIFFYVGVRGEKVERDVYLWGISAYDWLFEVSGEDQDTELLDEKRK